MWIIKIYMLIIKFLSTLRSGVEIYLEDNTKKVTTRPCIVTQQGKCEFRIILTQGYNRQIRRMCQALGYNVLQLNRIRIMNITLGNLPLGHYRNITKEELNKLLSELK